MNYRYCAALVALAALLSASASAQTSRGDNKSLGDIARALRDKKPVEVQITSTDARELMGALDEILKFASTETGYQKRMAVKRQVVGRDKVSKELAQAAADSKEKARLLRSEVVLKKFGLLPPDYDLRAYFEKDFVKEIAGYYNSKDRTMYLMNWVPLIEQRAVMAHELTHALQDQNYGLLQFMASAVAAENAPPKLRVDAAENAELSTARRAIVEGQAMLVYMDYLAQESGTKITDSEMIETVLGSLRSYDAPVVLHDAPEVLKQTGFFPYEDGLAFVMEVLAKNGRAQAFDGMFVRPPQSSHEILQPAAYMKHEKPAVVTIPDLSPVLPPGYEPYDAGTMGELDVRIMAREFGRENDLFSVAQQWNGGAYVVVKRPGASTPVKTAELEALYVSRWKTIEAAKRFAQIYQKSLPKRVKVLEEELLPANCAEDSVRCKSPIWASRVMTDEGPTYLEIWPGNIVLITHGFEEGTVSRLRQAVLSPSTRPGAAPARELHSSLWESRTFVALQQQIAAQVMEALRQR